jgi:Tfp pilus assembly protein PilP
MKRIIIFLSYLLTSISGLLLALFISSKYITQAYSQGGPEPMLNIPGEAANPEQEVKARAEAAPEQKSSGSQALESSVSNSEPQKSQVAAPSQVLQRPRVENSAISPVLKLSNDMQANLASMGIRAEGLPYIYDPSGKRDPFLAPANMRGINLDGDIAGPLEQFELDQLKIVGILWDINNPKAMIKDPNGKIHMVKHKTKLGRRNGYIKLIREGEVVVIESTIDDGKTYKNATVMVLKK